jgi:hypothetical protein
MAGGAGGFIGGFNPLDQDPIEYSGKWGLKEQVQAIAAGRWTGIPTFELYAWGQNAPEGRLGDNTRINRSSPVQVSNTVKWEQPAAGYALLPPLQQTGHCGLGDKPATVNSGAIIISRPGQAPFRLAP